MDCDIQNIKCEICGRVFHKVCHAEPFDKVCDSSECFHKKFWLEIIKEKDEHVIINGICYYLDKARPMSDSPFRGYGGREFKIKLHTGEIIVTNNLWHNGEVPKEFRDRLPDNAELVK